MSIFERREHTEWLTDTDHRTEDALFANQRLDGKVLDGARKYKHCTFANVSFKDAKLVNLFFEDCVFIGCYFRHTQINECHFPASRFIDCDFSKPRFFDCSLAYARFTNSWVAHDYISASIGGEHNIRRDLSSNLALEAEAAGHGKDARCFRLDAISAHEAYLRAAYRHETDYYKNKFQSLDQLGAWFRYCASRLNGFVWGYGERGWPLIRNVLALSFIVFPVLLILARSGLSMTGDDHVDVFDCWYLSFANILNNTSLSGVVIEGGWARAICTTEAIIGIISLGLFVTLLFRAVTRR